MTTFSGLVDKIIGIINLIIPVLVGIAFIVFFWGIFRYIATAGDSEAHEKGRQLIIWGIIALFLLFALRGILGVLQATFLK